MSLDYEKQLEAVVDRELKGLRELTAPEALMSRIAAAIEQRSIWYQRPWPMWPLGIQAASLLLLMALFGGLCFSSWKVSQVEGFTAALQRPLEWISGLGAMWHAFTVVLGSIALAIKQLHTGILFGLFAALALGYAMCLGLGTVYVRLGMARPQS